MGGVGAGVGDGVWAPQGNAARQSMTTNKAIDNVRKRVFIG